MVFNEFRVIYLFIFAPLFRKDKHFWEKRLGKVQSRKFIGLYHLKVTKPT